MPSLLSTARPRGALLVLAAVGLLFFLYFALRPPADGKHLGGYFLTSHCSCGHDVFILVEDSIAYHYCPGHKLKQPLGLVSRTPGRIHVRHTASGQPLLEIKKENDKYWVAAAPAINDWQPAERVTNPLRTTLPWYRPN